MAWELLTDVLKLPKDRLYVTYFGGTDSVPADLEAKELWLSLGYSLPLLTMCSFYILKVCWDYQSVGSSNSQTTYYHSMYRPFNE